MEIGKDVGPQKSRVLINRKAQAALRQDLNVVRKPHFDEKYFDTSYDPTGYYVSPSNDSILTEDGYNRIELPFDITADLNKGSTEDYRTIKVKTGSWNRCRGYGYDAYDPWEVYVSNAAPYTFSNYNYDLEEESESEDDYINYWTAQIATDTSKWIYIQLQDSTGDPNGLNPSKLVILMSDDKQSILDEERVGYGLKHYTDKIIGHVANIGGKLVIRQMWRGNIKDQFIVPDTLTCSNVWTQDPEDQTTTDEFIKGLDYYMASNTSPSYGSLQDYHVKEELGDSDEIVGYVGDRAFVYYDVVGDTPNIQLTKKYARADASYADNHTYSGKSIEIVSKSNASSKQFAQIFHFFEPLGSDITELTDFSNISSDGTYLVLARDNTNSNYPKIQYLDLSNVASNSSSQYCEFFTQYYSNTVSPSGLKLYIDGEHYTSDPPFDHGSALDSYRVDLAALSNNQAVVVTYTVVVSMAETSNSSKDSVFIVNLATNAATPSAISTSDTHTQCHLFCNDMYSEPSNTSSWPPIQYDSATVSKSVIIKKSDLVNESGAYYLFLYAYTIGDDVNAVATLTMHTIS